MGRKIDFMNKECRLCVGRVCTPLIWGRLINDTGEEKPVDTSKLKATTTKIEDCELRESLKVEDNKLELGC